MSRKPFRDLGPRRRRQILKKINELDDIRNIDDVENQQMLCDISLLSRQWYVYFPFALEYRLFRHNYSSTDQGYPKDILRIFYVLRMSQRYRLGILCCLRCYNLYIFYIYISYT